MAGRLVQGNELYIVASHALPKVSDRSQRQNSVTVGVARHVVDQIHHTVLQTAGVKTVHHVQHQRAAVRGHYSRHNL